MCRYVKELMKDAGLTIREDAMGNIYGRMHGSSDAAGTGHTDHACLKRRPPVYGRGCALLSSP